MKINSSLARWAYAWNVVFDRTPYWVGNRSSPHPLRISLCALAWRSLVLTPLMLAAALAGGVLILIGMREVASGILAILALAGIVYLLVRYVAWPIFQLIPASWGERFEGLFEGIATTTYPVFKGVVATKKRLCPIWEVGDANQEKRS